MSEVPEQVRRGGGSWGQSRNAESSNGGVSRSGHPQTETRGGRGRRAYYQPKSQGQDRATPASAAHNSTNASVPDGSQIYTTSLTGVPSGSSAPEAALQRQISGEGNRGRHRRRRQAGSHDRGGHTGPVDRNPATSSSSHLSQTVSAREEQVARDAFLETWNNQSNSSRVPLSKSVIGGPSSSGFSGGPTQHSQVARDASLETVDTLNNQRNRSRDASSRSVIGAPSSSGLVGGPTQHRSRGQGDRGRRNHHRHSASNHDRNGNGSQGDMHSSVTSDVSNVPSGSSNAVSSNTVALAPKPKEWKHRGRLGGRDLTVSSYSELSLHVIELLNSNQYECMICYETIKRSAAIWSCLQCFAILHLGCVKRWCRSSSEGTSWRCPGCQFVNLEVPTRYSCFCGEVVDPAYDPYLVPHSCGEPCGRPRTGTECPHRCNLICHPGPCPPCQTAGRSKRCLCGRTEYFVRCSDVDTGRSCGTPCGKKLPCGQHRCKEPCHAGDCPACSTVVPQTCFCGRVDESRVCPGTAASPGSSRATFSCEQVCDRVLDCGAHRCAAQCHAGPCAGCPTLPDRVRTCPCGHTPLETLLSPSVRRTSCTDLIPTCSHSCERYHPCGHTCEASCHHGPCPPCDRQIRRSCRCGATSKDAVCGAESNAGEVFCDKQCNKLRACGRHRCNLKCCLTAADKSDPDGVHVCRLQCGKKLKCGSHTCDLLCHLGFCPPCPMVARTPQSCSCGKTIRQPPIPCGSPPVDCPHPCAASRSCGHPCPQRCHPDACPPCVVLVERTCAGGHGFKRKVPCHVTAMSCGHPCARALCCGEHTCIKVCHPGECPGGNKLTLQSCQLPCGAKRVGCGHPCAAKCHPCEPCPDTPCMHKITAQCSCHRLSEDRVCSAGHVLECDDECRAAQELAERNRRLAEAFGPPGSGPAYSDDLRHMCHRRPGFITNIEEKFQALLLSRNSSALGRSRLTLNAMTAEERAVVHELAQYYKIKTNSSGVEPTRAVALDADTDATSPTMLLSEVVLSTPVPGASPAQPPQPPKPKQPQRQGPRRTGAADAAWGEDAECSRITSAVYSINTTNTAVRTAPLKLDVKNPWRALQ